MYIQPRNEVYQSPACIYNLGMTQTHRHRVGWSERSPCRHRVSSSRAHPAASSCGLASLHWTSWLFDSAARSKEQAASSKHQAPSSHLPFPLALTRLDHMLRCIAPVTKQRLVIRGGFHILQEALFIDMCIKITVFTTKFININANFINFNTNRNLPARLSSIRHLRWWNQNSSFWMQNSSVLIKISPF